MFKSQQNSETARLAADVVGLLQAWWRRDRIRSSPHDGKLLRLAPGAILYVGGRAFEVRQRDVIETTDGSILRYRCRSTDSIPELWITLRPSPQIVWTCGDDQLDLTVGDIEIWSEGGKTANR